MKLHNQYATDTQSDRGQMEYINKKSGKEKWLCSNKVTNILSTRLYRNYSTKLLASLCNCQCISLKFLTT